MRSRLPPRTIVHSRSARMIDDGSPPQRSTQYDGMTTPDRVDLRPSIRIAICCDDGNGVAIRVWLTGGVIDRLPGTPTGAAPESVWSSLRVGSPSGVCACSATCRSRLRKRCRPEGLLTSTSRPEHHGPRAGDRAPRTAPAHRSPSHRSIPYLCRQGGIDCKPARHPGPRKAGPDHPLISSIRSEDRAGTRLSICVNTNDR